jgi:hypothetical protein
LNNYQYHKYQRAAQLLAKLKARYDQFIEQLPPSLGFFARQSQTYYGPAKSGELESPPAALRLPWLFWEDFKGVPDDLFLDVAEAGACFFLGSILLDHLVDKQGEDSALLTLLQRAFWVRGDELFHSVFPPDSVFWEDYNRLMGGHARGLASEQFAQSHPGTFTLEKTKEIAGSKICPALVGLSGLSHLMNKPDLLTNKEKILKDFAIGTQFIDDLQDWREDLASDHLTYFLTCVAPEADWVNSPWLTEDEIERMINSSGIDMDHCRMGVNLYTRAIDNTHDMVCPGWTDYIYEKRRFAKELWDQATAKHLLRAIEKVIKHTGDTIEENAFTEPVSSDSQGPPESRALEALLSAQRYDGAWTDFDLAGQGISDAWVTAHIGLKLATLPKYYRSDELEKALESALNFLDGKWHHGWGFNDFAPVDADTTAHTLLFYQKMEAEPPPSTVPSLLDFQRPDGGFATYDKFRDPSMPESWCISHQDVTPLVVRSLLPYHEDPETKRAISRAVQRMELDRLADGTWPAFWWNLRWYTTAAWIETFTALEQNNLDSDLTLAVNWETGRHDSWGCITNLDLALLLECAVYSGNNNVASELRTRLIKAQLPNGLWPAEEILCQTTPGVYQPWTLKERETLYRDEMEVYASASILRAISMVGNPGD